MLLQDRSSLYQVTADGNYAIGVDDLNSEEEIEVEVEETSVEVRTTDHGSQTVSQEAETELMDVEQLTRPNPPVTPSVSVTPTSLLQKKKSSEKHQMENKNRDGTAIKCAKVGILYYEEATKVMREQKSHKLTSVDASTLYYEVMLQKKSQNLNLERVKLMKVVYGDKSDEFTAVEKEYFDLYPLKKPIDKISQEQLLILKSSQRVLEENPVLISIAILCKRSLCGCSM